MSGSQRSQGCRRQILGLRKLHCQTTAARSPHGHAEVTTVRRLGCKLNTHPRWRWLLLRHGAPADDRPFPTRRPMDTKEQHFEGELCVVPRKAESRSGSWTWPPPSSASSANRKNPPQEPANSTRGMCAATARRSWPNSPRRKHPRRTTRTEASDSPKRKPARWRAFSCHRGHERGSERDVDARLPGHKHDHQCHSHESGNDVHGSLGGEPVAGRRGGHLARGVGSRCVHGLKHGRRPGPPLSDKHS